MTVVVVVVVVVEVVVGSAFTSSIRKCRHGRTKQRCAGVGIAFEPVVFEIQGGIELRAAAILHRIAKAMSAKKTSTPSVCKKHLLEHLALIIARWSSKTIRRRVAKLASGGQT